MLSSTALATVFNLSLFAVAMQGFLIAGIILMLRGTNRYANRFLSAIVFIESFRLFFWFLALAEVTIPVVVYVLLSLTVFIPALLYFYISALTNEHFRLTRSSLWHLLPLLAYLVGCCLLVAYHLLFVEWVPFLSIFDAIALYPVVPLLAAFSSVLRAAYCYASYQKLIQHQQRIERLFSRIENLSLDWIRHLIIVIFAFAAVDFLIDMGRFLFDVPHTVKLTMSILSTLLMVYILSFGGMRQPAIFSRSIRELLVSAESIETKENAGQEDVGLDKEKYHRSKIELSVRAQLWQQCFTLLKDERLYLNGELCLADLSERLGISSAELSQVINEEGGKTFYEIVNSLIVDEAKRILSSCEGQSLKIITVGLESGFQSQSTFYKHFKKHTGKTPKQFSDEYKSQC